LAVLRDTGPAPGGQCFRIFDRRKRFAWTTFQPLWGYLCFVRQNFAVRDSGETAALCSRPGSRSEESQRCRRRTARKTMRKILNLFYLAAYRSWNMRLPWGSHRNLDRIIRALVVWHGPRTHRTQPGPGVVPEKLRNICTTKAEVSLYHSGG
jgi:hypothetical protein